MERLTDCAQGYCEMYCKKYMLCFEDPEDCIFKDEIKLYDAIKSIEGIVPFDRLLELADADRAGKLVVLPPEAGGGDGMICPKCGNVITHNSYFDAYYCPRCGEFIREKPPMTNADRIRAMTDDELAEAISSIPMCVGTDDDKDCENDGCKGCFLKWLQQPSEEDDHGV